MRLDVYLTENGFVKSRELAKSIIKSGGVSINGQAARKPSQEICENDDIALTGDMPKYVGRGGLKIEKALCSFQIDVNGFVCADIGASTGGFTDCLLQNSAAFVYAVDVGHGQLDSTLANDGRVCNMEGTNIKEVTADSFAEKIDFICTDVSFISLTKVIPVITNILSDGGQAVMLIKPQFECGKADIGKNGIVRSPKVHERVIREIASACEASGLGVKSIDFSPIRGGDGNIEYLIYVKKHESGVIPDIKQIVTSAHDSYKRER